MNSESVKDEDVFLVSPCEEDEEMCSGKVAVEQEAVDDGQNAEIECKEDEEGEAQRPHTLRDPGTPSPAEVEEHNITHMQFRTWCPACVHERQETNIINDEIQARRACQRSCSTIASWAPSGGRDFRDSSGEGPSDPHDLRSHGAQERFHPRVRS